MSIKIHSFKRPKKRSHEIMKSQSWVFYINTGVNYESVSWH